MLYCYRGKSLSDKKYVYGNVLESDNKVFIHQKDGVEVEVDKDSIDRSIGYIDKNGVEIFFGDIVRFADFEVLLFWWCKELNAPTVVRITKDNPVCYNGYDYFGDDYDYTEACVMLQDPYGDFYRNGILDIEIIDNIYENKTNIEIDDYTKGFLSEYKYLF